MGVIEGAWRALGLRASSFKRLFAASSLFIANRTALTNDVFPELARFRWATRTLATGSALMSRMVLPITAAEAPVTMAIAELLAAA